MIENLVLLAGGLATRLKPVTEKIPKAMIEIDGEPFISHQLRLLKKNNIARVVLCVGFLGDMIQDFVKDGRKWGVHVEYSFDGEKLLGTAGAIKKALPLLSDPFFVMYGDSYLPTEFQAVAEYFLKKNRKALMTVVKNDNQWDKSNVIFEKGEILKYDKKHIVPEMKHIDYGLGIFRKSCFDQIKEDEIADLADIYRDIACRKELLGYEIQERFYEIGSFSGIKETEDFIKKEKSMNFAEYIDAYLKGIVKIAETIDRSSMEKVIQILLELKKSTGRLFIIGVGGSAGNASHAVNDFRKLLGIESYAPTDNVSELTARINDDGWDTVFANWLKGSRLHEKDCILVISVGGGNEEKNISVNIVKALKYAKETGSKVIGLVGRDGGYTAKVADAVVIVPTISPDMVTPLTEAYHAVIWHMLVSHPALKAHECKWESTK